MAELRQEVDVDSGDVGSNYQAAIDDLGKALLSRGSVDRHAQHAMLLENLGEPKP